MTTLALINEKTMVCQNVTLDDRPASEIVVAGYIVLDLATIPSAHWEWNPELGEWEMVDEGIGNGGIGDTWDGVKLIAPKPTKPLVTDSTPKE